MFQQVKAISPAADADTRFTNIDGWQFAANLQAVPVTVQELPILAREYAIVFTTGTPVLPVAVLGMQGKNVYVTPEGQWNAKAVPAQVRNFPFHTIAQDGKVFIVRDAAAPHFAQAGGVPLYEAEGKPSDFLDKVRAVMNATHEGVASAAALAAQLDAAGLLADAQIQLTLADGQQHTVSGFKSINEAAASALDEAARAKLLASGALAMLVEHRLSLSNLGRVVPQPAAPANKASKARAAAATVADEGTPKKAVAKKPAARKPAAAKDVAPAEGQKVAAKKSSVTEDEVAAPAAKKPRAKKAA